MKKQKLTKKEKLALYKAQKAEEKQRRERYSQLADYLAQNAIVYVTNLETAYVHDCMILPKDSSVDDDEMLRQMRMLYGNDCAFRHAPGRFSFPVASFFNWAKNTNPHLFQVVPPAVHALYVEGLIDFSYVKTEGHYGESAVFAIIRL